MMYLSDYLHNTAAHQPAMCALGYQSDKGSRVIQLASVTSLCCVCGVLQVTAAEKAASEPPKLGKHRYEAPAVAVLTSDEVTGSLRQIKVRQE